MSLEEELEARASEHASDLARLRALERKCMAEHVRLQKLETEALVHRTDFDVSGALGWGAGQGGAGAVGGGDGWMSVAAQVKRRP